MGNSELLPCPFCGGEAELTNYLHSTDDDVYRLYGVRCLYGDSDQAALDCAYGVEHSIYGYFYEYQAIEAWNTRAETRAERDLRDEVNWLNAELHGAEMAASGETVLLDEQYSHAMRLVEELHQVLSLNGGGYLDEFGSHEG